MKTKTILRVGLIGALALAGYKGINYLQERSEKPMPAPDVKVVENLCQSEDIELNLPRAREGFSNVFLTDEDGDGLVDIMRHFGNAEWIAEGYTPKYFGINKRTKIMTPEMREAASRLLAARKDLYFQTWKKVYELENKATTNADSSKP